MRADHVGREAEVQALGQSWRLSRWERGTWEAFLSWCRPRLPDPLEVAKKALAVFPAHMHDAIVRHAIDQASFAATSNSPQVQALLGSAEGTAHVLALLLKKHHPEADDDLAMLIAMEVGGDALKAAFETCAGRAPEGALPNGRAPAG